tara:strand:- start:9 stop:587 length:579 start_codon:yes stop_codon:yes gene_type:complete
MIEFTSNLYKKLKENTPISTSKMGFNFQKTPKGFIRFEDKSLSDIYLQLNKGKSYGRVIFKYKYNNDNNTFTFKGAYIALKKLFKDENHFYEIRYDSKFKFDSIYKHFIRKKIPLKDIFKCIKVSTKGIVIRKVMCIKDGESYWLNYRKRDFTDELKMLYDMKIIKLNKGSTKFRYMTRDNKDSIYIKVNEY